MGHAKKSLSTIRNMPPLDVMRARADHFWGKVLKTDSCWGWSGAVQKRDGIALWLFNHNRVRYRIQAHRASAMLHGFPINGPDDIAYRKCRNGLCVNPAHLAVGDHEDNVASRQRAGTTARGVRNGRAKLTEEDVAEIKLALRKGADNGDLAALYEVNPRAIWGIANNRVWKHVEPKRG